MLQLITHDIKPYYQFCAAQLCCGEYVFLFCAVYNEINDKFAKLRTIPGDWLNMHPKENIVISRRY